MSVEERQQITGHDPLEAIAEARVCAGDPATCYDIIRQWEAIGIDEFMGVVQFNEITHEESLRTIRLMGEHVIPRFRNKAAEAEAAE